MSEEYDRWKDRQMEHAADHFNMTFKCVIQPLGKQLTLGKEYRGRLVRAQTRAKHSKSFLRVEVMDDTRTINQFDPAFLEQV